MEYEKDLPVHARERLAEMRAKKLFTSDLSVNEFMLVRQAGFEPLGLVLGSSIYQVVPTIPQHLVGTGGGELTEMTRALNHARELAMGRMEEEASALGADGIIGVRLTVNLNSDPSRLAWNQYKHWQRWARSVGYPRYSGWMTGNWPQVAWQQWLQYCQYMGWGQQPPPWAQPPSRAVYAWGQNVAEFVAVGTAVRHRDGQRFVNKHGKPFQSDLTGQQFWLLLKAGYRPVGFVMGNCVYYVAPELLRGGTMQSCELSAYTHALYDARELAIERLQYEAEALEATGIVGVTVSEHEHAWRTTPWNAGNAALISGEMIELFVLGTAVVPVGGGVPIRPELVISANDGVQSMAAEGSGHE